MNINSLKAQQSDLLGTGKILKDNLNGQKQLEKGNLDIADTVHTDEAAKVSRKINNDTTLSKADEKLDENSQNSQTIYNTLSLSSTFANAAFAPVATEFS